MGSTPSQCKSRCSPDPCHWRLFEDLNFKGHNTDSCQSFFEEYGQYYGKDRWRNWHFRDNAVSSGTFSSSKGHFCRYILCDEWEDVFDESSECHIVDSSDGDCEQIDDFNDINLNDKLSYVRVQMCILRNPFPGWEPWLCSRREFFNEAVSIGPDTHWLQSYQELALLISMIFCALFCLICGRWRWRRKRLKNNNKHKYKKVMKAQSDIECSDYETEEVDALKMDQE